MDCRIEDFRYKEVVNIVSGTRLGFVSDVAIDLKTGRVTSLIILGAYKFFGLLGREDDYIIPWESIKRIGEDIVLIEIFGDYQRGKRQKQNLFKWDFIQDENEKTDE